MPEHTRNAQNSCALHAITLHYIKLHYRHFKRHLHLKWPVVHQQLHVIRNTAHRPSTQASYTASRVRLKRKISCAAAQIATTLTISFPRWRHMSLTSYWGQQLMSLTSYPRQCYNYRLGIRYRGWIHAWEDYKCWMHRLNGPLLRWLGLIQVTLMYRTNLFNIHQNASKRKKIASSMWPTNEPMIRVHYNLVYNLVYNRL